jgi:hypothetical protein
MKKASIIYIILLTGLIASCKKEETRKDNEEILSSDYELQLLTNETVQVQIGKQASIPFNLLHKGVVLKPFAEGIGKYSFEIEALDSITPLVVGGSIGGSENYAINMQAPPRQGLLKYRLLLRQTYKGAILASKTLYINVVQRTDGWIFKEIPPIAEAIESDNNELLLTDGYTLYKADQDLRTLTPILKESNYYYPVSANQNRICAVQYPGRILLSEDNGAHFKRLLVPVGTLTNAWMYGKDLIAASADSCKVSINGGASWESFFIHNGVSKVSRLADGTYFALSKDGLYRAALATATAQVINFTGTITDIAVNNNTLYILSISDVYQSTDKGNSFQKIGNLGSDYYQIVAVKNNRFYLRTYNGELGITNSLTDIGFAFKATLQDGFAHLKYMALSGNRVVCYGKDTYPGLLQH